MLPEQELDTALHIIPQGIWRWKLRIKMTCTKKWQSISSWGTRCHAAQSVLYSHFLSKCIKRYPPYRPRKALRAPGGWGPPEFLDNQHKDVARLSALRTCRLYPQEISLILISVTSWVDLRATVWPEELTMKNPNEPIGDRTRDFTDCNTVPYKI
jgi:hypothetical protein